MIQIQFCVPMANQLFQCVVYMIENALNVLFPSHQTTNSNVEFDGGQLGQFVISTVGN